MRIVLYAAAALAVAAVLSPSVVSGVLAAAASTLFESVPFVLAGTLLQMLWHDERLVAYLGCGCVRGPSARSIPAALATALIFGGWVASARFLAATALAAATARRAAGHLCAADSVLLLGDLRALATAAIYAGCASQVTAYVDMRALSPVVAVAAGIALGFVAAPCALGAVGIAAALHARSPAAAAGFLCVAGIVDARAIFGHRINRTRADATGYLTLAAALGIVAVRHGDALVRPAIALPLGICAPIALVCAMRCRRRCDANARLAPAIMLAGALVTAPPPAYAATETTLSDVFAGERLDFTGRLARDGHALALVRYAITCCRADAAPVVVRLSATSPLRAGTWMHASGVIDRAASEFRLRVSHLDAVSPPADPFVYR